MPLDWTAYDAFAWANSQQVALTEEQRLALEQEGSEILGLESGERERIWGSASPPGRYAATVIRLVPDLGHRFRDETTSRGMTAIGLKLFKTTGDAAREAETLVPFHRSVLGRLPGLPNERVQRSLSAGFSRGRRGWVVQEWMGGESLEDLVRRRWVDAPIAAGVARSLLRQLLVEIVVPLWVAGTVWWDFRDANYVYDEGTDWLSLIDVDSLAAYADEVLTTPKVWAARDRGRETACARLRRMAVRVVLARGLRPKSKVEARVTLAWNGVMEPVLQELGRTKGLAEGQKAVEAFLGEVGI